MKKFNQRGFGAMETVLVLVLVGIVAFVLWYVFNAKSNTDNTYDNSSTTQTNIPPSSSSSGPVVQTKTDSQGNKYLADSHGKTLYVYDKDTDNTSNCTGACLTNWPAYKATSSSANLPANVGTITRTDGGGVQYTYNKMPLYYFTGDTSAGQVTGNGIEGFSLATP